MRIPQLLGDYEIGDAIGAGGMGTVYRARKRSLQIDTVVKVLHPHWAEDPEVAARFATEATSAASIDHINTVRVFDYGEQDGLLFIAMEYVEGLNLKDLLRLIGPPPRSAALLIFRDLCRGLEAAHEKGVVHRDLKPENLAITSRGVVKIMDFGLARHTGHDSGLTIQGTVLGTAAYMSPEQALGRTVDQRSDIFSMGLVGYELLSGKRAYPGGTAGEVTHKILTSNPVPLSDLVPDLEPELLACIEEMTQRELDHRCRSISTIRDRLEMLARRLDLHREDKLLQDLVAAARGTSADATIVKRGPQSEKKPVTNVESDGSRIETPADGPTEHAAAPAPLPQEPVPSERDAAPTPAEGARVRGGTLTQPEGARARDMAAPRSALRAVAIAGAVLLLGAAIVGGMRLVRRGHGRPPVHVGPMLAALELEPSSMALSPGEAAGALRAMGRFVGDSTAVFTSHAAWRSADPAVASVTAAGIVTAVSPGETRITAAVDSLAGEALVSVVARELQARQIESAGATAGDGKGTESTTRATPADETTRQAQPFQKEYLIIVRPAGSADYVFIDGGSSRHEVADIPTFHCVLSEGTHEFRVGTASGEKKLSYRVTRDDPHRKLLLWWQDGRIEPSM